MASFTRPERRALSDQERVLLEWLMANGAPDAHQYAPQLSDLKVIASCTCGCPSIDLAVGDRKERTKGPSQILADFDGITPEGIHVGVILHAREGQLSELEVYAIQDFDGPFNLPKVESLERTKTST